MAPYYDRIEREIGVCGNRDDLEDLPDGIYNDPPPLKLGDILLQRGAKEPGTTLSEAAGQDGSFFHALKNLTADGYYTSRIGLMQELGYNGDAVLAAFHESTIPEH